MIVSISYKLCINFLILFPLRQFGKPIKQTQLDN